MMAKKLLHKRQAALLSQKVLELQDLRNQIGLDPSLEKLQRMSTLDHEIRTTKHQRTSSGLAHLEPIQMANTS